MLADVHLSFEKSTAIVDGKKQPMVLQQITISFMTKSPHELEMLHLAQLLSEGSSAVIRKNSNGDYEVVLGGWV